MNQATNPNNGLYYISGRDLFKNIVIICHEHNSTLYQVYLQPTRDVENVATLTVATEYRQLVMLSYRMYNHALA
jgi:hypothetical protein